MIDVSLARGYSLLTLLGVASGALAVSGYFYHRAFGQLPPSQWRALLGLRAAAILVVLLLLFRPALLIRKAVEERRDVIFVLDTSASMATGDETQGETRFDQARSRVISWWRKLGPDFHLHLIEVGEQARPLEGPGDLMQRKPDGQATSLKAGLLRASQKAPPENVEAVILLSDGIHNSAGDPVETAGRLGLKIHTIGVGNSLRGSSTYRDVQVTGLECPEQIPVNNRARLTAYVDGVHLAGRLIKVVFEEDGKPLGEVEAFLDEAEGPQEAVFQFVPTVKGRHSYTARVGLLPEEKIEANNHRSTSAVVVDSRIRVLYIEGTLRAEFGALVDRFLARSPDIEFCALVQTRKNVFVQRTNMEGLKLDGIPGDAATLDRFNVFLLGDLDSTYLKPEQMDLLVQRVRKGAGLLMLGGYHSLGPGGYGGTALESVLPVLVGDREIGQLTEPFLPQLTPEGQQHPIFTNIESFFPTQAAGPRIEGLPPLEGCVKVAGARTGAMVLATHPGTSGNGPMPVLAIQPLGEGRTAVFTGDTTRSWHQVLRGLNKETPFIRFWGQMVRWLAGYRAEDAAIGAGIEARADQVYYDPGSPISIFAGVRNREGEGTNEAKLRARIKGPDGMLTSIPLTPSGASVGSFQGIYEPKRSGSYTFEVEASLEGKVLKAESIVVDVGRSNLEYDRLDLDEKLLGRIAEASGGRYLHISTADRLIEELDRQQQGRTVVLEQRLYSPLLCWVLVIALLSTEWFLRKRYRLR